MKQQNTVKLAKIKQALALLQEAADLLDQASDTLGADIDGKWDLKDTAKEVRQVISCDNNEAGLSPLYDTLHNRFSK